MIQSILDNLTAFSNVLLSTFIIFYQSFGMELHMVWKIAVVYTVLFLFFIGFIMYLKKNTKVNLLYILAVHLILMAILLTTMETEVVVPLITTIYIIMGTSICAYRIVERAIPRKRASKNQGLFLSIKMFLVFIVLNILAAVTVFFDPIIGLITVTLPLLIVHTMHHMSGKK